MSFRRGLIRKSLGPQVAMLLYRRYGTDPGCTLRRVTASGMRIILSVVRSASVRPSTLSVRTSSTSLCDTSSLGSTLLTRMPISL